MFHSDLPTYACGKEKNKDIPRVVELAGTHNHTAVKERSIPRYCTMVSLREKRLSQGVLERALGGELLLGLDQDLPDGHQAVGGAAGLWGKKFQGKFRENWQVAATGHTKQGSQQARRCDAHQC